MSKGGNLVVNTVCVPEGEALSDLTKSQSEAFCGK